jgi:hypothetical protein
VGKHFRNAKLRGAAARFVNAPVGHGVFCSKASVVDASKHRRRFAMTRTLIAAAALSLVATVTFAQTASAPATAGSGAQWRKEHHRRAEVNHRLNRQDRRIHEEVKEGDMTKQQAAKLHKEDKQIRQEERDMAVQNGGHITKQEQKTLNQQENKVSKQIGK